MNSKKCEECMKRKKLRSEQELVLLTNRLNKITGQLNGIKKMLENDAYCTDVLQQVSATHGAFNAFTREVLESHIKTCVVQDIRAGNNDVVDELLNILKKLMK